MRFLVLLLAGGMPQAFKDHVSREREKWSRLIKQNNIVVN